MCSGQHGGAGEDGAATGLEVAGGAVQHGHGVGVLADGGQRAAHDPLRGPGQGWEEENTVMKLNVYYEVQ